MKFKDIVKKIGKKGLYVSFPYDLIEKSGLKRGDAVEIDFKILKGDEVD